MQQRPGGITLITVLAILSGLAGLFDGILLLINSGAIAAEQGANAGTLATIGGVLALLIGIFSLFYGIGLWQLKPWAWTLALVGSIITIVFLVISAVVVGGTALDQLLRILFNLVIVYYLFRASVRNAFAR